MEETQQASQSLNAALESKVIIGQLSMPKLSQKKIDELDSRRSNLLPPRKHTLTPRRRSPSSDLAGANDVVKCQCGWNEEEDDLVQYDICSAEPRLMNADQLQLL